MEYSVDILTFPYFLCSRLFTVIDCDIRSGSFRRVL